MIFSVLFRQPSRIVRSGPGPNPMPNIVLVPCT
jgi:hypothetical protein